ncbi:sodium:solute symporter [Leucobacter sp. OLJS4]|uniref:sodium:solute symporter family protein n=1 Tax=unclassified Leucobacter TaxID=2621730 RepID=UPI000C17C96E|nr:MULTISPECIES: sodium:solute symporter [unclassified Leucobacter]PIJ54400.1 sodium:solute symporter [Leucobacter sp. OLES1]PII86730.1 sodium:solute symporter [Leucobacter sp. OLCALW19]PII88947.1 sodium:solute symporter [Leucobacter sp. OLAS13]PII96036.1 sodium:solute symporter [Leucobacter sp. OLTLW20]PII96798.1 sodium:solute symporter [Leucobacter sp. OLCS4]
MTVAIIVGVGILALGALGIAAGRQRSLTGWAVNGRRNSAWVSWFLLAGEGLTTFTFLGLAGLAFDGGVGATFAIAYLTISYLIFYFAAPRIRELGTPLGAFTISDFFAARYGSRRLGRVVAVIGALALIPYLQLQIVGLGTIVELVTGSAGARGLSMVLASALVVLFVIWAGIRGVARVAVVKDVLMVVAMLVIIGGLVISFGGIPEIFTRVAEEAPGLLTMRGGAIDPVYFLSATIVTSIGSGFCTLPHFWPMVLGARNGAALRKTAIWQPVYFLLLFIPVTVGFAGALLLDPATPGNAVLLGTTARLLPDWLLGVIAVGGAAAAMVPAGGILIGISTLVSQNVFRRVAPERRLAVNAVVIVTVTLLALLLGLARSDIGALLLLTYGCTTQFAPAIACALADRVRVGARSAGLGILAGSLTVAVITFGGIPIGSLDAGLIALVPNLLVLGAAEAIRRCRSTGVPDPIGSRAR